VHRCLIDFFCFYAHALSARINKLLQTIDPNSRAGDHQHEAAINKTLIMQTRINNLRENLKTLQTSYDDALNQSQIAETLLNTKLGISEALIRDQLENNMKQRSVQRVLVLLERETEDVTRFFRLTSLDLRRQKLIEQSTNLLRRVDEVKLATTEWKSNLTNLSVGQSGLTSDSSTNLRNQVTRISQEVKKLEDDMKAFVNQMYKLQDMSKNFERDIRSLQLSVQDASQVYRHKCFKRSLQPIFCRTGNSKVIHRSRSRRTADATSSGEIHYDRT
jgi:hypothetical protein